MVYFSVNYNQKKGVMNTVYFRVNKHQWRSNE